MRFLFVSAAIITGSFGAAQAADLAARPFTKAPPLIAVSPWTGWYAGINGGGAWSTGTGSLRDNSSPAVLGAGVAVGFTPLSLDAKHNGGFGGGQIGYNWQTGSWLLGIEADIQGASIGSTASSVTNIGIVRSAQDNIGWFGTLRGRAGFVADNVLFYGTGGLAYGNVKSSFHNVALNNETIGGSVSATRAGWAAGAGIEWAFAPQWTLKGEYLHIDLGSTDVSGLDSLPPPNIAVYRFKHEFDSARIGVNYRFGGPVVAKY